VDSHAYAERLAVAAAEYRRAQALANEYDEKKREADRTYRTALGVADEAWAVMADLVRNGE
jgi:hypothetical protein